MKIETKTFDDYMSDENRIAPSKRERILYEASLIGKMVAAREKSGLSQRDLARLSGVKQPAIARMESLRAVPQIDTLLKVLNPLGYTIEIVPINEHVDFYVPQKDEDLANKFAGLIKAVENIQGLTRVAIEKANPDYPLIHFVFSDLGNGQEDALYDALYEFRLTENTISFDSLVVSEEEIRSRPFSDNFFIFKRNVLTSL